MQGFQRVADGLERDVASTRERFEAIVAAGCGAGWLDRSFEEGYLGSQGYANGSLPSPEAKARGLLLPMSSDCILLAMTCMSNLRPSLEKNSHNREACVPDFFSLSSVFTGRFVNGIWCGVVAGLQGEGCGHHARVLPVGRHCRGGHRPP